MLSQNPVSRGRTQLLGLTVSIYESLTDIYKELDLLDKTIRHQAGRPKDGSNDWETAIENLGEISERFSKYTERQLDRAIFLGSSIQPPSDF